MFFRYLLWTMLYILSLGLLFSPQATAFEVRVLILESASQLTLSSSGPFQVSGSPPSGTTCEYPPYERIPIVPEPLGWKIADRKVFGNGLKVESIHPFSIQVNGRTYRGRVEIHKEKNRGLQAINVLPVEEYLRGVIKEEISPQWSLEALKAQAVVARTFALRQVMDNPQQLFHLKANTESQMYGGKQGEDLRSDLAVQDTKGLILTYEGEPLPAFYHAACGGHTEDAAEVWSYNHSSLQGVPCSYCQSYPVYAWQASIKEDDIRRALWRWGYQAGEIEAIVPLIRSKTNRIRHLEITHGAGRILMEGRRFRQCLGYDLIRSTNFTVKRENGGFTFQGRGWGHGVGLCQWGAKGMADRAFSYQAILQHYYPGSRLSRVEEREN